ncbi:hypothetical protein [Chondromyces apiculatus]|uniref:Uncharacterized protein n=1 Tax=Chondromyces apiculatus DSM 436 TaxID=1192034 RepID=A0A017TDU6_9BACT|nr:hypothetical protein [Chondromyces apiculatus]EYF07052.1 Hypothetical protein CAP_1311 [Chondromyces apiculatus DSM 436]
MPTITLTLPAALGSSSAVDATALGPERQFTWNPSSAEDRVVLESSANAASGNNWAPLVTLDAQKRAWCATDLSCHYRLTRIKGAGTGGIVQVFGLALD